MYENLLPLGSVVLLEGGQKRLMITGRIQAKQGDEKIYDYSACYYPEGIINSNEMVFFDHEAIVSTFYIGFQDVEEFAFRENVLANLGELRVVDGRIEPVEGA